MVKLKSPAGHRSKLSDQRRYVPLWWQNKPGGQSLEKLCEHSRVEQCMVGRIRRKRPPNTPYAILRFTLLHSL